MLKPFDTATLLGVKAALLAELSKANKESEHARQIVANPYSGHEHLQTMHRARGFASGVCRGVEVVDALLATNEGP